MLETQPLSQNASTFAMAWWQQLITPVISRVERCDWRGEWRCAYGTDKARRVELNGTIGYLNREWTSSGVDLWISSRLQWQNVLSDAQSSIFYPTCYTRIIQFNVYVKARNDINSGIGDMQCFISTLLHTIHSHSHSMHISNHRYIHEIYSHQYWPGLVQRRQSFDLNGAAPREWTYLRALKQWSSRTKTNMAVQNGVNVIKCNE